MNKASFKIGLVICFFSISSLAGISVRGGGDEVGLDFQSTLLQTFDIVTKDAEFSKLMPVDQLNNITLEIIVIEKDILIDIGNGEFQNSIAANDPLAHTIEINRSRWKSLKDKSIKQAIALHEALSILGLEKTGNYSLSGKYAARFGISPTTLTKTTFLPVTPNTSFLKKGEIALTTDVSAGMPKTVLYSPDGFKVLIVYEKKGLVLIDIASGKETNFSVCKLERCHVAFSPDPQKIIVTRDPMFSSTISIATIDIISATQTLREYKKANSYERFLAISRDGTKIIIAEQGSRNTFVIDILTGHRTDISLNNSITIAADFSTDGKKIVLGSSDGDIHTYDFQSAPISVGTSSYNIKSIIFSPTGNQILVSSNSPLLIDLVPKTQTSLDPSPYSHGEVAVFSPDGTQVLTGEVITNLLSGYKVLSKGVISASFSADGKKIVAGFNSGLVKIIDLSYATPFIPYEDWIMSVAFSPDGKKVLTSSFTGVTKISDLTLKKETVFKAPPRSTTEQKLTPFCKSAYSPDGTKIVMGAFDHTAKVIDLISGSEIVIKHTGERVCIVEFSSDGTKVLTGGFDNALYPNGELKVTDLKSGKMTSIPGKGLYGAAARFSPDGNRVGSSFGENEIQDTDLTRGYTSSIKHSAKINAYVYSFNGLQIVTASDDKTARVTMSGRSDIIIHHDGPVTSAAFSPDGSKVITASSSGVAKVTDLKTRKEMIITHFSPISAVAFFKDGSKVSTGSTDGLIKITELNTGDETLYQNTMSSNRIQFSPNGNKVFVDRSLPYGNAKIIDLISGNETILEGHDIGNFAYSPDETQVVFSASQNSIYTSYDAFVIPLN